MDMDDDLKRWFAPFPVPDANGVGDRYAISQLMKIYALGIDMRSYALCRSPFADSALCEGTVGKAAVDEYMPKVYQAAVVYEATQHNVTNQHISLDGAEALMWSEAVAYHMETPGNGRENLVVGVQYRDLCKRFPQGWLIVRRNVRLRWVQGPMPRK